MDHVDKQLTIDNFFTKCLSLTKLLFRLHWVLPDCMTGILAHDGAIPKLEQMRANCSNPTSIYGKEGGGYLAVDRKHGSAPSHT